jgi:hypothetical protein
MHLAALQVHGHDLPLPQVGDRVRDTNNCWYASALRYQGGMAVETAGFCNYPFCLANRLDVIGAGFVHHQDFARLDCRRCLWTVNQTHPTAYRSSAYARALREHGRDDAHLDEVGGAADARKGAGGLND